MESECSFSVNLRNLWFLALGIPLLSFQYLYIRYHLPLIRAASPPRRKKAPICTKSRRPRGATASSPTTMRRTTDNDPESMWEDEPLGVVWEALWDAPGDHAGIDAWYKDRLQADGWKGSGGARTSFRPMP